MKQGDKWPQICVIDRTMWLREKIAMWEKNVYSRK